jgi:hypothetical protein
MRYLPSNVRPKKGSFWEASRGADAEATSNGRRTVKPASKAGGTADAPGETEASRMVNPQKKMVEKKSTWLKTDAPSEKVLKLHQKKRPPNVAGQ